MSRSGYSEDIDEWALIRWRGQVASAIRGKRGQRFLSDLYQALVTMPDKRLIANSLEDAETGEVCAMGALGRARGIDMRIIDPEEPEAVARAFDIAHQLAAEVAFMNDEYGKSPEQRYKSMLAWVGSLIKSKGETQ